jgi:hypothetical protein
MTMIKDTGAPMSWSRWLRGVAWCGVGALLLAIPTWGMTRVIAMVAPLLLAVAMAGTVSALTDGRTHPEPTADGGSERANGVEEGAWWCLIAAACASVVLCAAIVSLVSPSWVLVWLGVVLATTPPVLRMSLHFVGLTGAPHRLSASGGPGRLGGPTLGDRRMSDARTTVGGSAPDASGCHDVRVLDLDTSELCRLWRVTFWMVRDVRSPARTVAIVDLRQAVLDELERRRPDAVRCWLTSGRGEADGPARYL